MQKILTTINEGIRQFCLLVGAFTLPGTHCMSKSICVLIQKESSMGEALSASCLATLDQFFILSLTSAQQQNVSINFVSEKLGPLCIQHFVFFPHIVSVSWPHNG